MTRTVLIVEDEPVAAETLREYLRQLRVHLNDGASVVASRSGSRDLRDRGVWSLVPRPGSQAEGRLTSASSTR